MIRRMALGLLTAALATIGLACGVSAAADPTMYLDQIKCEDDGSISHVNFYYKPDRTKEEAEVFSMRMEEPYAPCSASEMSSGDFYKIEDLPIDTVMRLVTMLGEDAPEQAELEYGEPEAGKDSGGVIPPGGVSGGSAGGGGYDGDGGETVVGAPGESSDPECTSILPGEWCDKDSDAGIWSILQLVLVIMSAGVGVLATVGLLISGMQWLTARDKEDQIVKAKSRIFNIVIGVITWGLMWLVLSWLIPGGLTGGGAG